MRRIEAREQVFCFLYQVQVQVEDVLGQRDYFFNKCQTELGFEQEDMDYITRVTNGVLLNYEDLDAQINQYLKRWTMDRLPKVDVAILRLALYEILHENIGFSIIVNEAVMLAKKFSSQESHQYINGVLARFDPEKQPATNSSLEA